MFYTQYNQEYVLHLQVAIKYKQEYVLYLQVVIKYNQEYVLYIVLTGWNQV